VCEVVFFCTYADLQDRIWRRANRLLTMQQAAFRLAGWQLVMTGFVAAIAGWLGGSDVAVSAAMGGSIGIVAGLYQALRMFRIDASKDPDGFLRSVYVGEAVKILLTVALMIAAIRVLQVEMLPFMAGYIAIYIVYWMALKTGFPWIKAEE
jgi:ATP synthase protein I